jgi:GH24 family phage-related lysozyme (muramidase)
MTRRKIDVPSFDRTKSAPKYFNNEISTDQKFFGVYLAIVKNTHDIQHMGRLQVYLPDWGGDEDNKDIWRTVSYCAPFGGSTPGMERYWDRGLDYDHTPTSYGMWAVPPDIGNKVYIMFINGDQSRGIWIGVMYDNFMNFNVPGLAAYDKHDSPDQVHKFQNVAEYNKWDKGITNPLLPHLRPWHKRQYDRMSQTAQHEDPYRGWTTSSAQRETPSAVYGMSTPGPIDPDAIDVGQTFKRAGGHTFVMDDGDIEGNNRLIRLRARGGAQLLIHDTLGFVYICNKMGTAWVELDRNGNVEVFSNNTISLRSNEDINMRADRDFNLDIGRDMNIYMPNDYETNEEKQDQDEVGINFKYSKISGLKSPVPNGSIVLHNLEGEVHTKVDKGNVYHTMGAGDYNHLLENGSFYRTIKSGLFNGITAADYSQEIGGIGQHHAVGDLKLASDNLFITRGAVGVMHLSGGDMNVDVENSIFMSAGFDWNRTAGLKITDDARDIFHNSNTSKAAEAGIVLANVFAAYPAEKPEIQEFEDMIKYDPMKGPETVTVERRLTRYPTMEPYGGLRGKPGFGSLYHIDETTTGFFESVFGDPVVQTPSPVDEFADIYPFGQLTTPYDPTEFDLIPVSVEGTPTDKDTPGQYVGVKYDAFGDPVYEKEGESTAKPAATATLSGKGVDIIKEFEGLHQSVFKSPHNDKDYVGYGHELNKDTQEQVMVQEVSETATEIVLRSTEKFPPFGEAKLGERSEWISWANKTANKLLGVTRALHGTSPQKHPKGTPLTFYGEKYDNGITRQQADALFDNDIKPSIEAVRKNIKTPITQNQADALISLGHSLGPVSFASSTVATAINQKNFAKATTEFMRYNKVKAVIPEYKDGIVSKVPQTVINSGMTKRRLTEATLFSRFGRE